MRGTKKGSLNGQFLLYLRKEEVKLRVKGYNKARYVPSANMLPCVGHMQLGQGSLSIYTAGPQLRKNFWSKFSLLLLTALVISIFHSSPPRAKQIFAKLKFWLCCCSFYFKLQICIKYNMFYIAAFHNETRNLAIVCTVELLHLPIFLLYLPIFLLHLPIFLLYLLIFLLHLPIFLLHLPTFLLHLPIFLLYLPIFLLNVIKLA